MEIPTSAALNAGDLKLSYQPTPLTIANNGHAIQVDYQPNDQPNNTVEIQGTPFLLQQFHIHGASEHTLAGQRFPMELHFVHKSADGRVVAIGVLIKSGAENPAYAAVLQNMPAKEGDPQTIAA